MKMPYHTSIGMNMFYYNSEAAYGTISTKYFGEKFDAEKVETYAQYSITIYPPENFGTNTTLHIELEKNSMHVGASVEQFKYNRIAIAPSVKIIDKKHHFYGMKYYLKRSVISNGN